MDIQARIDRMNKVINEFESKFNDVRDGIDKDYADNIAGNIATARKMIDSVNPEFELTSRETLGRAARTMGNAAADLVYELNEDAEYEDAQAAKNEMIDSLR